MGTLNLGNSLIAYGAADLVEGGIVNVALETDVEQHATLTVDSILGGAVRVFNGGKLIQSPTGSLGGTVTVSSGGLFAPRSAAGTVNVGGLILDSGAAFDMTDGATGTVNITGAGAALSLQGATLDFDLPPSGNASDRIDAGAAVAGVTGTNTINVTPIGGGLTPGSVYSLVTASSGLSGSFAFSNGATTQDLVSGNNNYVLSLTDSDSALTLAVTAGGVLSTWNSTTNGNWNTAANWYGKVVPLHVGDSAVFNGSVLPPNGMVNLDTSPTLSALTFNLSGILSILASGSNTLTFDGGGGGAMISSLGINTIAAPIFLKDNLLVTVVSGSTLNLSGFTSIGGGARTITFNDAGTLAFGSIASGADGGSIAVVKTGAGTATLTGAYDYRGPTTVSAGTLIINGSLNGAAGVAVGNTGTLSVAGTINGPVSLNGGASLTTSQTLTLDGTLDVSGTRNAISSGTANVAGLAMIESGGRSRSTARSPAPDRSGWRAVRLSRATEPSPSPSFFRAVTRYPAL